MLRGLVGGPVPGCGPARLERCAARRRGSAGRVDLEALAREAGPNRRLAEAGLRSAHPPEALGGGVAHGLLQGLVASLLLVWRPRVGYVCGRGFSGCDVVWSAGSAILVRSFTRRVHVPFGSGTWPSVMALTDRGPLQLDFQSEGARAMLLASLGTDDADDADVLSLPAPSFIEFSHLGGF